MFTKCVDYVYLGILFFIQLVIYIIQNLECLFLGNVKYLTICLKAYFTKQTIASLNNCITTIASQLLTHKHTEQHYSITNSLALA